MTDSTRPTHTYPFSLEQITGSRPAPPRPNLEEEERQWDALPELPDAQSGMGWDYTFSTLYDGALDQTYAARAHYLQSHEATPPSLMEACASPRVMRMFQDPEDMDAQAVEEQAAFLNEVAAYFAYWENRAMEHRNNHIVRLRELGWGMPQIASLLGLSKQRVHAILEAAPARTRGAVVRSQWGEDGEVVNWEPRR